MAGILSVPAENLIPAEGLTVDECATVEFLSIGAHAVRRGAVTSGNRVLVVGAGPIGLGVALFARLTGADVAVIDTDRTRAVAARSIVEANPISLAGASAQSSGGHGFDVVFDATGNQQAMERGFEFVAHGGRYVLVSVIKDPITFRDPDFHRKEMTLFGSRNATSKDFAHVMAAIRGGHVDVARLITHRASLQDAVANIPIWAAEKSGLVKALIEID